MVAVQPFFSFFSRRSLLSGECDDEPELDGRLRSVAPARAGRGRTNSILFEPSFRRSLPDYYFVVVVVVVLQ